MQKVQLAAQRAMCNTTRYFGGYMAKTQKINRCILEMAKHATDTLLHNMEGCHPLQQVHKAVFRCINEWESKGTTRTAYEEMNLALHANDKSALAAECITSCPHAPFYGGELVTLVRRQRLLDEKPRKECITSCRGGAVTPRVQTLVYAYRPLNYSLKYLSAWEFTRHFDIEPLWPPGL